MNRNSDDESQSGGSDKDNDYGADDEMDGEAGYENGVGYFFITILLLGKIPSLYQERK